MSTYSRLTKNPKTGKFEKATWIDDYFGHHLYGVEFPDGSIADPEKIELETKDWESPMQNKQINTTNWEVEFDRRWFKIKLDTIVGKDGLYVFDRETLSQFEPIKQFIKDLLASSQKDKEVAVEEERQRIFSETADLRIVYGKKENIPAYKLVNDTIRKIWLVLGAKQNKNGDFELESLKSNERSK